LDLKRHFIIKEKTKLSFKFCLNLVACDLRKINANSKPLSKLKQ